VADTYEAVGHPCPKDHNKRFSPYLDDHDFCTGVRNERAFGLPATKRCCECSQDHEPVALPLKRKGRFEVTGWDSPNRWAIDANDQIWLDVSGHGFWLVPVGPRALVSAASDEGEHRQNEVRKALGLAIPEPRWMKHARAAGWTPPEES
jgi:hypothetical protein